MRWSPPVQSLWSPQAAARGTDTRSAAHAVRTVDAPGARRRPRRRRGPAVPRTGDRRIAGDQRRGRGADPAAHPRRRTGALAPVRQVRRGRRRRSAARPVPRHGAGAAGRPRGERHAAPGAARHLGPAARPGGRADRVRPRPQGERHGVPQLPRARRRVRARGRHEGPAGHLPVHRPQRLGLPGHGLPPVHHRDRQPGAQRRRLRPSASRACRSTSAPAATASPASASTATTSWPAWRCPAGRWTSAGTATARC
jgi:hypothetical protein